LREISDKLDVSKGSVSAWVRDVELNEKAKARIEKRKSEARDKARQTKKKQRKKKYKVAAQMAKETANRFDLTSESTRIMCALLYWCEGATNRDQRINFTNSDPDLVELFLKLLRNSFDLNEEKFRVIMHLHDYHNEAKQKEFWQEITSVPKKQFNQTHHKAHTKKQTREGYPGCISLRYYDVSVSRELLAIADKFTEKITGP
jgi:hypothetical protein